MNYNQLKHPLYVISKGRWKIPMTVRALNRINVPHFLAVEPQEESGYREMLEREGHKLTTVLVTPFSNLGQGSIPVRNWVWKHALGQGAAWHWCL